jgi:polyhydroxybutyrate depolymerase
MLPPAHPRRTTGQRHPDRVPLILATAALATAALVLAACATDGAGTVDAADGDAGAAPTTTAASPLSAGCAMDPATVGRRSTHERVDLVSGGTDRWYHRFVPGTYDGTPAALVVDLHGYLSGADGQVAISQLGTTAERHGFVVATPQGSSDLPYWNAVSEPDLPDDVTFVGDVIDDVTAAVCIDPDRVYVDGFSNGAFLASLVGCELSDRVAAVAAVAGLMLPDECGPSRPVPVLAIHGTEDRHVGFRGEPGPALDALPWNDDSRAAFATLPWADVTETAAGWAALDDCDPEPARTDVSPQVELVTYRDCAAGTEVVLHVVDGGGHTWPGSAISVASRSVLGATTTDIDANEVIWAFFADHPMPPGPDEEGTS